MVSRLGVAGYLAGRAPCRAVRVGADTATDAAASVRNRAVRRPTMTNEYGAQYEEHLSSVFEDGT